MSAQRREDRPAATRTSRRESGRCWRHSGSMGAEAMASSALQGWAGASGATAGPGGRVDHPANEDLFAGAPRRMATKSLRSDHRQSDCRTGRLNGNVGSEFRRGSPPVAVRRVASTCTPESPRLSPPPTSSPSRLHPAFTEIPDGQRRWAERYDGKRDLHFQHAARNAACDS